MLFKFDTIQVKHRISSCVFFCLNYTHLSTMYLDSSFAGSYFCGALLV